MPSRETEGMNGKTRRTGANQMHHPRFPRLTAHYEAACFNCDEPLVANRLEERGNPQGEGRWVKHCAKCGLSTCYDLAQTLDEAD